MSSLLAVAALMAVALGGTAALVFGAGVTEPLVPSPEAVVHGFVNALSAGRYTVALKYLGDSLKEETTGDVLRRLDQILREEFGEYEFALGGDETIQGMQATYAARIDTARRGKVAWEFRLERDRATRLWKITLLP